MDFNRTENESKRVWKVKVTEERRGGEGKGGEEGRRGERSKGRQVITIPGPKRHCIPMPLALLKP